MTNGHKPQPNSLIHETSPYLLQHAFNPVSWRSFAPEAFEEAVRKDKPVLISIGYSACHWCHVMERESFEDAEVAEVMNRHFVNVKVDREERSDVDMLYMQAVQLMTGQGGWPLNCFVMPDGRPFYGGTYFPKKQWLQVLNTLSDLYQNNKPKVEEYAARLSEGILQTELLITRPADTSALTTQLLKDTVAKWKQGLDNEHGGPDRAPKFPMPSNYRFLLRYAMAERDDALLAHVELTLRKMAFGGIYDQLRGGFARYSVDNLWKVPHFEKMLYDNAQLVSLYTEAYNATGNTMYRRVAEQTLQFVLDEWYRPEGYFYSAYDADSEGEEGKFYVWSKEELEHLLAEDFPIFGKYYEISSKGYWEDGNYILMRRDDISSLLAEYGLSPDELEKKIASCAEILKKAAEHRTKPGLDDKTVCSWNAMMCTAFAQAYLSYGVERYRDIALHSVKFLTSAMKRPDAGLFRTFKNGIARIDAFLEDYVFVTEALINCYLISRDRSFLDQARDLCGFSLNEFSNAGSDFFYYSPRSSSELLTRPTEVSDNVIPASNSQMAINLHLLGNLYGIGEWTDRASKMLEGVCGSMVQYGPGYSNWGILALRQVYPFKEVAIVGKDVDEKLRALYQHGFANAIFAVSEHESELPLLANRYVGGKTMIYVCENKACRLPVEDVNEAIELF